MNTQEKIEQRRKEAAKAQSLNKKRAASAINDLFWKRLAAVVIVIVVLAGIFALLFPQMAWSRRVVTAVTVGDEKISTAEYSYYYRTAYQNYYNTLVQYLGEGNVPIDTNLSLEKQQMSDDMTYAEYFSNSAISTLRNLVMVETEAKNANFALPQEYQEQLEQIKTSMDQYAAAYNMTTEEYLSRTYGFGFNQELFEKVLVRELLVAAYEEAKAASFTYTDDQLDALYEANKNAYDTADFRIIQFASSDNVSVEEAKAQAEACKANITDEASYEVEATKKLSETAEEGENIENKSLLTNVDFTTANSLDPKVAEFVFNGDHPAGYVDVVESNSGLNFYVIYIVTPAHREEAPAVDVRHILIQCDVTNEEEDAGAKEMAESIYQDWLENPTEEYFAQLAASYSSDGGSNNNGGLYTALTPGATVKDFNDWCFDENNFVGNSGIVHSEYGYHIMYLSAIGEPTWKLNLSETQRQEDINAWRNAGLENYPATTTWLGLQLRNEPIGY